MKSLLRILGWKKVPRKMTPEELIKARASAQAVATQLRDAMEANNKRVDIPLNV
jgi:hypothetical protein